MNGVSINSYPSLLSCEEIPDENMILESHSNKAYQWK